MRIVCPACNAAYDVADALLVKPRPVRCARCARDWVPRPDPAAAIPVAPHSERLASAPSHSPPSPPSSPSSLMPPPADGAPDAPRGGAAIPPAILSPAAAQATLAPPTESPSTMPRRRPVRLAWAASILVLSLLGAAGYAFRDDIMHVWQPSVRLYQALGLASVK